MICMVFHPLFIPYSSTSGSRKFSIKDKYQEGYIVKVAIDKKWLLIDEFNIANMNKAHFSIS
jgi:hypothetical protein